MIAQVINLSPVDVFRYYCNKYNIFEGRYSFGLYGLELRNVNPKEQDIIIKNVSTGGDKVYHSDKKGDSVDLFLVGSIRRFKIFAERISNHSSGSLPIKIFNTINFFENYDLTNYKIGKKLFEFKQIYIMGILNVTPDSFSDGGKYLDKQKAVDYAIQMLDSGIDIIDIGGESSRPGAESVDAGIEINRVIPVVEEILSKRADAVISVDTTKRDIAEKALRYGALMINDISGGTFEPEIMQTVAAYDAAFVIMHMKGTPKDMQIDPSYENVIEEVYDFLDGQVKKAKSAGINQIFIDPGIGFGKSVDDNFYLLKRLDDFKSLSYPIMTGISRKSFIGKSLNLNIEERDTPTSMLESLALEKGARIIRTHNYKNGVMLKELFNKTKNVSLQ